MESPCFSHIKRTSCARLLRSGAGVSWHPVCSECRVLCLGRDYKGVLNCMCHHESFVCSYTVGIALKAQMLLCVCVRESLGGGQEST